MGITITDAKIVTLCSKCRTKDDEISRFINGEIIPDKDIACINEEFGNCRNSENSPKENLQ